MQSAYSSVGFFDPYIFSPSTTLIFQPSAPPLNLDSNNELHRDVYQNAASNTFKSVSGLLKCNGCAGVGFQDQVKQVWYCSSECQKSDWSMHKIFCKAAQDTKKLHNAVSTLQKLFMTYRMTLFDRNIDKVESKDGKLHLYDDGPANLTRIEICRPFPIEMFKRYDVEVMKAALDYLSGDDAMGWMFEATQ
jgi:hypothetical protein